MRRINMRVAALCAAVPVIAATLFIISRIENNDAPGLYISDSVSSAAEENGGKDGKDKNGEDKKDNTGESDNYETDAGGNADDDQEGSADNDEGGEASAENGGHGGTGGHGGSGGGKNNGGANNAGGNGSASDSSDKKSGSGTDSSKSGKDSSSKSSDASSKKDSGSSSRKDPSSKASGNTGTSSKNETSSKAPGNTGTSSEKETSSMSDDPTPEVKYTYDTLDRMVDGNFSISTSGQINYMVNARVSGSAEYNGDDTHIKVDSADFPAVNSDVFTRGGETYRVISYDNATYSHNKSLVSAFIDFGRLFESFAANRDYLVPMECNTSGGVTTEKFSYTYYDDLYYYDYVTLLITISYDGSGMPFALEITTNEDYGYEPLYKSDSLSYSPSIGGVDMPDFAGWTCVDNTP